MTEERSKYIAKYALILALFYAIEYIASLLVEYREVDVDNTRSQEMLIVSSPYVLSILLNLATALFVYSDIQKSKLRTKYVILATVIFPPVGVCALLLYLLYDREKVDGEKLI